MFREEIDFGRIGLFSEWRTGDRFGHRRPAEGTLIAFITIIININAVDARRLLNGAIPTSVFTSGFRGRDRRRGAVRRRGGATIGGVTRRHGSAAAVVKTAERSRYTAGAAPNGRRNVLPVAPKVVVNALAEVGRNSWWSGKREKRRACEQLTKNKSQVLVLRISRGHDIQI